MASIRTHIRKSLVFVGVASSVLFGSSWVANSTETKVKTEFQQQFVTFPNGVTAHPDVVYAIEKGFRPLRLDIYNTPDQKGPKPIILFIHGGAWESGNKRAQGKFDNFPAIQAANWLR